MLTNPIANKKIMFEVNKFVLFKWLKCVWLIGAVTFLQMRFLQFLWFLRETCAVHQTLYRPNGETRSCRTVHKLQINVYLLLLLDLSFCSNVSPTNDGVAKGGIRV